MPDVIEESKSARAACKICKDKIPKGVPRFGKETIFKQGDKEYSSFRWHHFDCAIKKFPNELMLAEMNIELSDEYQKSFDELLKGANTSAFEVKRFHEFTDPNRKVNFIGNVARVLGVKEEDDNKGNKKMRRSVFIREKEGSCKLFLWEPHTSVPVGKGDSIVVIDCETQLSSSDKIEFHTTESSIVLLNPTDAEIAAQTNSVEIFEANTWNRPSGKPVEFEYAKSSRAKCKICDGKILKGDMKVVKPLWVESNEKRFPGVESLHVKCAPQDLNGEDLIHEAITRLTPDIVSSEKKLLTELRNILPDIKARQILDKLLS